MKLKSIGTKLSSVTIIGIFVIVIILSVLAINISNSITERLLGEKAMSLAISTAEHIDGNRFKEVVESKDDTTEAYLDYQTWMYGLLTKTECTYLYTIVDYSENEWMYVIDGSEELGNDALSLLGDIDDKDNYGQEPLDVYKDGIPRYSEIYDGGEWGKLISAFAPIKDSDGNIVGVVGADISANIVTQITSEFVKRLSISLIVILLIVILIFLYIVRRMLISPINKVISYSNKIADKDYAFQIASDLLEREDEVGVLVKGIESIRNHTSDVLKEIVASSDHLVESADSLSLVVKQTSSSIDEVSRSVNDIAANAVVQAEKSSDGNEVFKALSEVISQNYNNINQVVDSTKTMNTLVEAGKESMNIVVAKSSETSEAIIAIQRKLDETSKSSEKISEASSVIASIASQTNLLALNAAIEAARAGEQGKGFAVVAEEIRKLAEQSAQSTKEIDSVVVELITHLQETVEVMGSVTEFTSKQKESMDDSLDKYKAIEVGLVENQDNMSSLSVLSETIDEKNLQLQNIISEVFNIAESNAANTEEVSAATEEQNATIQEVSNSSERLASLAGHLKEMIDSFKLN